MLNETAHLAQRFKMLADPTRLRLLALCRQGECSVSELTIVLGQSQPRMSQQLKLLCDAGLLDRFRDGKRVFYRLVPERDTDEQLAGLLALIPESDPMLVEDWRLLKARRGQRVALADADSANDASNRALHRAILNLTVTTPIGDLLDIGCGRGSLLKLLASRANRAIGVDIDADARQIARAELLLAGIPNCSLRKGNMYRLPFRDEEFNTIIIDAVLAGASHPVLALQEARRLLKPGGRLFVLESVEQHTPDQLQKLIAELSGAAGLRLAPARLAPKRNPAWLLSVATPVDALEAA